MAIDRSNDVLWLSTLKQYKANDKARIDNIQRYLQRKY